MKALLEDLKNEEPCAQGCTVDVLVDLAGRLANWGEVIARLSSMPNEATRGSQREPTVRPMALISEDLTRLRQLYESGVSVEDIVEILGVDRSTVFRHLDKLDIQRRGGRKLDDEAVRQAATRYETGETLSQIGHDLGVHGDTVRAALLRVGVEIRPAVRPTRPQKLSPAQVAECACRYEKGETLQSLADEFGVHRETLRRSLKSHCAEVGLSNPKS